MSMFKKLLARVGIGAATVDTRLREDSLVPGETISGEAHITGGDVSQEIDDIYLYVATEYNREVEDTTLTEECILVKYRLSERFDLQAQEEKVIPFSLSLPYETPLTVGHQPVYLRTDLDISTSLDPEDTDYIEVRPHPFMELVLNALESLGFQLREVNCEYNPSLVGQYPFVQEFEFRPTGNYQSYLDELEVIFALDAEEATVYLAIDKRARDLGGLLSEGFDLDEHYIRFRVTAADLESPLEDVAARIDRILQSHID